ncbi:MAG: HEAT repeat domain-containing protein [Planctomycetota bacterium]|nr:MAG: HEAT repeat domain-containing protein [Planctomycetota bacterium]
MAGRDHDAMGVCRASLAGFATRAWSAIIMKPCRFRRSNILLTLTLWAFASGCGPLRGPVTAEQRDLYERAKALLLRAAQSDLDVVAANAFEALVEVAPDEAAPYFRAALDSPLPLVRFAGCVALGDIRERSAAGAIRRLLNDRRPRVRLAAAYALYRCGQQGHAKLLVDTLNTHPDENMRSDAALLIGRLDEPRALKRLKLAARREKSGKVAAHIFTAMARLGDRAALDELIRRVVQSDQVSKIVALQGLVELGRKEALEAFLYTLRDEGDYIETRLLAARGLGRIGDASGYQLAMANIDYRAADPTDQMRVRSMAAMALGAIGRAEALPALKRLAEDESDPRTQVAACYAICRIMQPGR